LTLKIEQREKRNQEREDKAYIAKAKKHFPFNGDGLLSDLKSSETLIKDVARESISWGNELEIIKSWYREQIRTAESMEAFFLEEAIEIDGNGVVMELFKRVIFKNETILSYLENHHLHWSENQPIIKSMVVKTIKSLQDGEGFELAELTKNGEEDFQFLDRLFADVIKQNDFLEEMIQKRTKNWDVERIALTDRVVLKLALVE